MKPLHWIGMIKLVSARVLCHTNKCFSMYAKSDLIHLKFYQQDDDQGTVYIVTHSYHHSPVLANIIPQWKALNHAVYGWPIGNSAHNRGWDTILEDLVKIALFMELRAHSIYMGSDQVNQSLAQTDMHICHAFANPVLLTLTGAPGVHIANGPVLTLVDMWSGTTWHNR